MLSPQYQLAYLSESEATWRIVWYNINPATCQLERIRQTFNLNRIKSITERRNKAGQIVRLINDALKNNWNYFVHPQQIQAQMAPAGNAVPVVQAINDALAIRKVGLKPRSASTYTSYVAKLTEWLTANELHTLPVADFTPDIFQRYIISKSEAGHSNKNINDHTSFFKNSFDIIKKKKKLITVNPIESFDLLPEAESKKFQPLTQDEIERIVPALIRFNPRFYLFCKFIPDQYMRPHHIARLKGRDISYTTDELHTGGDTAKTHRNTDKQLMGDIKAMLLELGYNKIPGNYYLFAGRDFMPGPKLDTRLSNTAAEFWQEIVIKGLGIQKQMYALKHTGAQYFVNNNEHIDVYYLRQQMEHSSARETEIYLQKNVKKKVKNSEVKTLKF